MTEKEQFAIASRPGHSPYGQSKQRCPAHPREPTSAGSGRLENRLICRRTDTGAHDRADASNPLLLEDAQGKLTQCEAGKKRVEAELTYQLSCVHPCFAIDAFKHDHSAWGPNRFETHHCEKERLRRTMPNAVASHRRHSETS